MTRTRAVVSSALTVTSTGLPAPYLSAFDA